MQPVVRWPSATLTADVVDGASDQSDQGVMEELDALDELAAVERLAAQAAAIEARSLIEVEESLANLTAAIDDVGNAAILVDARGDPAPDPVHGEERGGQHEVDQADQRQRGAHIALSEVAESLKVHVRTVERLLKAARITSRRDQSNGRKRYITAEEFTQIKQLKDDKAQRAHKRTQTGALRRRSQAEGRLNSRTRGHRVDRAEQLKQIKALRQEVETVSRDVADLRNVVATLRSEVGLGLKEVAKTLTYLHLEREQEQGQGKGDNMGSK